MCTKAKEDRMKFARLERRAIVRVGRRWQARGRTFQQAGVGEHVSGIVIGAANIGRGRFAMIETLGGDGGLGFSSCCGSPSSANASPGSCVMAVASTGILD